MKKYKKAGRFLCAGSLLVLYLALCAGASRLDGYCENALILLKTPQDGARAKQMRREEQTRELPAEFALWEQKNNVTARNNELQRSRRVSLILVNGSSQLVVPGNRLEEEDADGCLLDEKTAMALFGSARAEGLTIAVDGRTKTVRGILRGASDTVVCTAEDADALSCLSLHPENGAAPQKEWQDFAVRHGLEGRQVRADILRDLAGFFCFLIRAFLCLFLLFSGFHAAWRERGKAGGALWPAAYVLCFLLFIWQELCRIRLPAGLAPTKWSDFAFWRDWWSGECESILFSLAFLGKILL